ncbi:hypothetical protein OG760_37355 (plasmid) [Streptomyces sp. NBC_00963]|uniref:hypothetical protein n=1 Tax=Streptomyces sp. NBC_00963 TaxID=2903697 RepID=UPI002F910ACD|nr:hypothetical protein OG760_37355 [Streptomyces sp. NBC_00963]
MDEDLYAPRPIPPDWHAQELLVALVQAEGGELTFDNGHMLTTSTRGPGGEIWDVIYEPLPNGRVRLSLAQPEAGSVA